MSNVTEAGTLEEIEGLRARLTGDYVTPGDPAWDVARRAWNLAVDQHPIAVALPETADDVVEIVRHAAGHGYRVAAQGTGHSAAPMGSLEGTILLRTSRLRGVEIDPKALVARVEAGVLWLEAVRAAAEHGLAALAGSSPDVGVVGYSLGGGLSFLSRKHGLATNSIVAVELVTADGQLVRADAANHADLFWAVRGGGGNFGVVTALEFRLFPIAEVYAGALFFPVERASEVLQAWREWTHGLPAEMSSLGRVMQFPPFPEVPEPLRGNVFAIVETVFIGDEAAGADLIRPLRDLGPAIDTVATIPVAKLSELHMDPPQPVPGVGDGLVLTELPVEAVDTVVGLAVGSPLVSLEIRQLGGALADSKPEHGALASLDGPYLVFGVGMAMTSEMGTGVAAHMDRVHEALAPWKAPRTSLNFRERASAPEAFHGPDVHRRLQAVKARYDASDVIRANHPITPTHP
jgi:hypothetical protein